MGHHDVDEDTPLLTARDGSKSSSTPLPWSQLSILLMLQLAEPLTYQLIAPFLPQLIRDIGVTHGDDSRVGYYVGLIHSSYFVAQFFTVFLWSRASDHIGRRPIILIGAAGLSISMYCVGLSRTFWGLIFSRCLSGALNGNAGMIKSMVGEITDSTNIARAYSFIPITWFLGSCLGPVIGGTLERPAKHFPAIFGNCSFLKEYPYFLPCSISATFALICCLIVALFLKETIQAQMSPMDYLFGRWHKFQSPKKSPPAVVEDGDIVDAREIPLTFRELLVAPVLIATGSFALFSNLDVSFRSIFPVYLATPMEMGGLGLDPSAIGTVMAVMGIFGGISPLLFFTPLYNRLGGRTLFLITTSLFFPIAALFPIINRVGQEHGLHSFVWLLVGLQIFLFAFANFATSVTLVYINAAAPNRASIGAINGLAQVLMCVMRAIGPSAVNSAFALGIEKHVMGGHFAYWVLAGLAAICLVVGAALPKRPLKG